MPDFDLTISPSGFVHATVKDAPYDGQYSWDFGEDGPVLPHPVTGQPMRTGRDQTGQLAVFRYTTAGAKTITCNSLGKTIGYNPPAYTEQAFEPGPIEPAFDWVKAGTNRRAVLRRGGVYSVNRETTWNNGKGQHVVAEVGTGPLPIIRAAANVARIIMVNQRHQTGGETIDRLFENLAFDGAGKVSQACFFVWDDTGSGNAGVAPVFEHVYFAGCTFTGFIQAISVAPKDGGRYGGLWFCTADFKNDTCASIVFLEVLRNWFLLGTKLIGGNAGNKVKDHPLYVNCDNEFLCRWFNHGPGQMGYGINGNVPTIPGKLNVADNWLIDGGLITGVSHGIDFGNANNDPAAGRITRVQVQNCKINLLDVGPAGQASRDICLTCAGDITIHDNELVGHDDLATDSAASVAQVHGYRNKVTVFKQSGLADPRLNNTTPPGPVTPPDPIPPDPTPIPPDPTPVPKPDVMEWKLTDGRTATLTVK